MEIPKNHASIFVLKVVMRELDQREKGRKDFSKIFNSFQNSRKNSQVQMKLMRLLKNSKEIKTHDFKTTHEFLILKKITSKNYEFLNF